MIKRFVLICGTSQPSLKSFLVTVLRPREGTGQPMTSEPTRDHAQYQWKRELWIVTYQGKDTRSGSSIKRTRKLVI